MEEKTILSSTGAALISPFIDGWEKIFGWLIVAIVLIIADLNFGIKAARKRGKGRRRYPFEVFEPSKISSLMLSMTVSRFTPQ